MSLRARIAAAALLSLLTANAVQAGVSARAAVFDSIYSVDLATHKAVRLGETGSFGNQFIAIEGMAYAPDGTLYGISDNLKSLVRINPTTGAATMVGGLGLSGTGQFNNLDPGFAITADGRMWLSSALVGKFWQINPSTGAATLVGTLNGKISGLAARGNDLFGAGSQGDEGLYRIDTASGATQLIARFNATIPYAASISIAFDEDKKLWAAINYIPTQHDSDPIPTWSDLAQVDADSGAIQLLGTVTGPNELRRTIIGGLAIIPPVAPPPTGGQTSAEIPALSMWFQTLLASLLAGLAYRGCRRPA
ncbi:MAG: hypothetical protein ABI411_03410 [Tahibacter sp.]